MTVYQGVSPGPPKGVGPVQTKGELPLYSPPDVFGTSQGFPCQSNPVAPPAKFVRISSSPTSCTVTQGFNDMGHQG